MTAMFEGAEVFNQDISGWNVSSVTNMYRMFRGADDFDQNLGAWDLTSIVDIGLARWYGRNVWFGTRRHSNVYGQL